MIHKKNPPFISRATKRMLTCRLACISLLILCFISSTCRAQSFFSNDNAQQLTPSSASTPNKAMSPEEYKNMVKGLSKQNQDDLTRSVKQGFASQPAPAPALTPAIPSTPENPPAPAKMPAEISNTTPPAITSPPPPETPTTTATPAQSLPPAAPTIPVTPAPKNQTYTGFGSPDNTKTNQGDSSSPEKSTGWNIQY